MIDLNPSNKDEGGRVRFGAFIKGLKQMDETLYNRAVRQLSHKTWRKLLERMKDDKPSEYADFINASQAVAEEKKSFDKKVEGRRKSTLEYVTRFMDMLEAKYTCDDG